MMDPGTRAARRRNNAVARRYPLLAATNAIPADWLTTPEQEAERIARQRAAEEERARQREAGWAEAEQRALAWRARVAELVTTEEMAELDRSVSHLRPAYWPDIWGRALARLGEPPPGYERVGSPGAYAQPPARPPLTPPGQPLMPGLEGYESEGGMMALMNTSDLREWAERLRQRRQERRGRKAS